MTLKLFIAAALIGIGHAATAPASFEALLIHPDGTSETAFLVAATQVSIRYRESKESTEIKDRKLSELAAVRVSEPRDYELAIDLFQARKYLEARKSFATLKESFDPIASLPGNPGTLAAFHELECLRKLGDLEGLADGLKKFNKEALVRENHLRQIEMYLFWDAARTKNWKRLETLANDHRKVRLPGYQRAQVAYCHALALEGLGKPGPALDAYNVALTADLGASEEIARKSALAILRIHLADPEVKISLKDRNSTLPALLEARAMVALFDLSLGAGAALPNEYAVFR